MEEEASGNNKGSYIASLNILKDTLPYNYVLYNIIVILSMTQCTYIFHYHIDTLITKSRSPIIAVIPQVMMLCHKRSVPFLEAVCDRGDQTSMP